MVQCPFQSAPTAEVFCCRTSADHEIGVTVEKLQPFIESKDFENMSIGGGIDEGVSYESDKVLLFYQDKALLVLDVDCYGIETHGSLMPDSNITAIGKCAKVIESLQEYRDEQIDYMKKLQVSNTGDFTSINLNRLQGALTDSVLPGRITLRYYINPSTRSTVSEVFDELKERIQKLGSDIKLTIVRSAEKSPVVKTDDTNPYWTAISDAAKCTNITFNPSVVFDLTNAGVMRKFGIPVLGFSPLQKTEFLVHGINENINITIFLNGINLYQKSIQNLANLSEKEVAKDTSSYMTGYKKN
ncbi:Aminoacylase-1 [Papilio xuthus]|uniref:Aminoacylase-1 n=1 Tax=Papilio xuthus TaxID=66420 RepID=A0A194PNV2_PAPXU|nr:Aminoacylase-1 [Papilio xuthus]